jgi:hypothetical protein
LADPAGADGTMESAEQVAGSSGWTQKQQKSLETALACYTKGRSERWERIAKAVPGKTKVAKTKFSDLHKEIVFHNKFWFRFSLCRRNVC